jgi:hypothetical protein
MLISSKNTVLTQMQLADQKDLPMKLPESFPKSIKKATQEAVHEFHEMKSKKARLRKGSLKEIIVLAKKKYSILDSIIITTHTVRQRLKRDNGHAGHKSPMEDVEPYLVELIKKLAEMRTPVTTAQGLELANSLIKG